MISSNFKESQQKYLAAIVGSNPKTLSLIMDNIDSFYKQWVEEKWDAKKNESKKYLDGTVKTRIIRPSLNELKQIQSRLKTILEKIKLPDNIHGGVKGRSNISNSLPHKGKKYQLTTDLQNFYPSISHSQVYSMFLRLGYSSIVANGLTKLTTWKHELPQGTPTSTHIANLVFLPVDMLLIDLCREEGITYTRYVDDLTFSSSSDFQEVIFRFLQIIQDSGFTISHRKTKYSGKQLITGVFAFNNFIDAPDKIKQKAKEEVSKGIQNGPFSNYLNQIRKNN